MAGHELGNDKYFAGFLMLLAALLIALGVTIFPHRDTAPAPAAVTGGSREVPAPGNPPKPAGAELPTQPQKGG